MGGRDVSDAASNRQDNNDHPQQRSAFIRQYPNGATTRDYRVVVTHFDYKNVSFCEINSLCDNRCTRTDRLSIITAFSPLRTRHSDLSVIRTSWKHRTENPSLRSCSLHRQQQKSPEDVGSSTHGRSLMTS